MGSYYRNYGGDGTVISYSHISWPPLLPGQVPSIRNVIFNPPATIIYWTDGTKTVVKCGENDAWDAEKGLAMAVAKKAMGNKGNYNKALKRWLEAAK